MAPVVSDAQVGKYNKFCFVLLLEIIQFNYLKFYLYSHSVHYASLLKFGENCNDLEKVYNLKEKKGDKKK